MGRFGDHSIEDFFERVNALARDGIFVVHQMHLERDVIVEIVGDSKE